MRRDMDNLPDIVRDHRKALDLARGAYYSADVWAKVNAALKDNEVEEPPRFRPGDQVYF